MSANYEITMLPNSTSDLKNLKSLILEGCRELEKVPYLGKSLRNLHLSRTAIKEVPQGIKELVNLRFLSMNAMEELLQPMLDSRGSEGEKLLTSEMVGDAFIENPEVVLNRMEDSQVLQTPMAPSPSQTPPSVQTPMAPSLSQTPPSVQTPMAPSLSQTPPSLETPMAPSLSQTPPSLETPTGPSRSQTPPSLETPMAPSLSQTPPSLQTPIAPSLSQPPPSLQTPIAPSLSQPPPSLQTLMAPSLSQTPPSLQTPIAPSPSQTPLSPSLQMLMAPSPSQTPPSPPPLMEFLMYVVPTMLVFLAMRYGAKSKALLGKHWMPLGCFFATTSIYWLTVGVMKQMVLTTEARKMCYLALSRIALASGIQSVLFLLSMFLNHVPPTMTYLFISAPIALLIAYLFIKMVFGDGGRNSTDQPVRSAV